MHAWTGNVWGTVSFLIIVVGWLLTSMGARTFLSRNHNARKVAIFAVGIVAAINIFLNLDLARRSADIQHRLEQCQYVKRYALEVYHYGRYHLPYRNAVISDLLVGTMFVLVLYLLKSMKHWEESSEHKEK